MRCAKVFFAAWVVMTAVACGGGLSQGEAGNLSFGQRSPEGGTPIREAKIDELLDLELCEIRGDGDTENILSFNWPSRNRLHFLGVAPIPPDAPICKKKPDLILLFEGASVAFGAMTVVCSVPGPAQVGLPIFSFGGALSALLAFGVKQLPCDPVKRDASEVLTPVQMEAVERKVCEVMGKAYKKGKGPVERSRCL
jgi:hypothetical protein